MSKLVFVLIFAFCSQLLAADGAAHLDMVGDFNKGFDLQMNDDHITGSMWGFGRFGGVDKVDLTRKSNGGWNGRIGLYTIDTAGVTLVSENKVRVEMTTGPSGPQTFSLERKNGGLKVNGFPEWVQGSINSKGTEVSASNEAWSMDLDRRSDGIYEGTAMMSSFVTFPSQSYVTLKTQGALDPAIAKADAALYTVIYVMPFSLH
jgi:hypothetical protein